ncbi:MAG: AraC family transcriptional regulator [Myxococcaceae bacterium]|nr:AraC family transcriptional regulator [Myxococcaceae bacterium]
MQAGSELARLPAWFQHHALHVTSPAARQVLWALGRRLSGNLDVGFAMAERVPEDALGELWDMYRVAPSLRALCHAYDECSALLLDFIALEVIDDGSRVWIRSTPRDGTELDRGEQDFRCAMLVKTWRRLHRSGEVTPLAVHFGYRRPASVRAHIAALGTSELSFSQPHLQIALARHWVDGPLPGADAPTFAALAKQARERCCRLPATSLASRVDALITEQLARGASAASVARALGLSERSLRRRLLESGESFRALLDTARQREADLFLESAGLPLTRVARLLGFASGGALRNSMRRWSALSPSARRRAIQHAD